VRELEGHATRVNSVTFSPDGKTLFTGDAEGVICVWKTDLSKDGIDDIQRIKQVRETEIVQVPITHLEMGRSNFALIVHTRDNMVRVFETKVMVPSQRYTGIVCSRFQMMSTFSPDGRYILAGSEDGSVVLWTTRKSEAVSVKEWMCKFDQPVTAIAWNRVENMVAFSSFGDAQPILVFWDDKRPVTQPDEFDIF
jgi:jouberin